MTEQTNPADEEIMRLATQDDDAPEAGKDAAKAENYKRSTAVEEAAKEPLELGSDDAPEATPEQIAEDAEKKRTRSHSLTSRVNQLTARLRDAERRAAEAEQRGAPTQADEPKAPDASAYEFGQADPNYIKDAALFEVRSELAAERKKEAETTAQTQAQTELSGRINDGMAKVEKAGSEKYTDFEEKISEAVEARGGESLPPLIGVGIAVSPAGADIAYRLATDETAAAKLEKLATTNPHAAAIAFGELEGEYLDDDDSDLNPADPLDLARMVGREKSRRKGIKAGTVERKTTGAPKPPENRSRGAAGQFEVSDDTENFGDFEKKIMGGRR